MIKMWRTEQNFQELRKMGMIIGKGTFIGDSVYLDLSNTIEIGDKVVVTMQTVILTHDASPQRVGEGTKRGKVKIGNNVFIGVRSIILPGINIGDNVIIGAGSVVSKNIPSNEVWAGNPARFIRTIEEHEEKLKNE